MKLESATTGSSFWPGGAGRVLVVHPVINERANLEQLLPVVLTHPVDVLIVDDASTDGTAAWLQSHPEFGTRLHLILRGKKMGLGTAYIDAYKWALERDYAVLVQMDADLSHQPEDLRALVSPVLENRADLVIGSRYIGGVRVLNWPLNRLILSVMASNYVKYCLGWNIIDATAGFKAIHRRVLERVIRADARGNGYVFQVEVSYIAHRMRFRLLEVPVVFVERRVGLSKMNWRIIIEAILRVPWLRIRSWSGWPNR